MTFAKIFGFLETSLTFVVRKVCQLIGLFFGYPSNPGMPVVPDSSLVPSLGSQLPVHETFWPPLPLPTTWWEMLFGQLPKVEPIPRYFYESQEEGFYNFYIENYQNLYFLPDSLSEFLQIRCHICLDITLLETIREFGFVGLTLFWQLLILRVTLAWFLSLNPYQLPWYWLAGMVDWTDELFQGVVPSLLGINLTGLFVLAILGVMADNLNHLVFTMPFLPSEGEATQLVIQGTTREVLRFHYLPVLWSQHPIPDSLRQFWYYERPDILKYMVDHYQDVTEFLFPDQIVGAKLLEYTIDQIIQRLDSPPGK